MKFLGDMGVSQTVINTLRNYGYDSIHLRDKGLQTLPKNYRVRYLPIQNE